MTTRPFQELIAAMPPARRARLEEARRRLDAIAREVLVVDLEELRRSCDVSQAELAERLGTQQAQISRLERRNDALVSTLRRYVKALGGRLEICASFDGWTVELGEFAAKKPSRSGRTSRRARRAGRGASVR